MKKTLTDIDYCTNKLKVLKDGNRLAILRLLMVGPKHVNELNAVLKIEQSLLSHHLKVLRDEGFVISSQDGKSVLYNIASSVKANKPNTIDLKCCLLTFN
ncbi:MAG: ArsR/SmtB family transcription factor [Thermodesulfobacteriota bacterium]